MWYRRGHRRAREVSTRSRFVLRAPRTEDESPGRKPGVERWGWSDREEADTSRVSWRCATLLWPALCLRSCHLRGEPGTQQIFVNYFACTNWLDILFDFIDYFWAFRLSLSFWAFLRGSTLFTRFSFRFWATLALFRRRWTLASWWRLSSRC